MTGSWQGVFLLLWFLVVPPEKVSVCHNPPFLFSVRARTSPSRSTYGRRENECPPRLLRNHIILITFSPFPALWVDCMLLDSLLFFALMLAALRLRSSFLFIGTFPPRKHHLF